MVQSTSTSIQTSLVAQARLAEEHFLLEEQTLNKARVSDIPSRKSQIEVFQIEGHNLEPR
jgi:hypothetical protein